MALMFAVIYDNQDTARQALSTAEALANAGYATILEQALITRDDKGKYDVSEEKHPVRRGAIAGGIVGGLLGTVFLAPVAGAAAGAAIGGVLGKSQKGGAEDFKSFTQSAKDRIPNGGAAMVLLGQTDARDRVVHDLGSYGGTVLSFDLPDDALAALQKELDRAAQ